MDITLQIIITPSDHIIADPEKNARRIAQGDIIDVCSATKYATLQPDGNYLMWCQMGQPRFAFVHVKNVPDIFNKRTVKDKLTDEVNILDEIIRHKQWHIPKSILPAVFKQKILEDRQVTVEFSTAKAYIRKKTTPALLDPASDDISTPLTDGDLE